MGDDPAHVAQNRIHLGAQVLARPNFLHQVHGTHIVHLQSDAPDSLEADGAYTGIAGVACTVMAADCLPILLCNRAGTQVAALHAGWRGLAGTDGIGILEVFHREVMLQTPAGYAQAAMDWIAWLGPCIGPLAFEVGAEVRTQLAGRRDEAGAAFAPSANGKYLANLPMLARQRLADLGVQEVYGNDGGAPWCTVGNPSCFFSHRRDRVTGRHAACIWLK